MDTKKFDELLSQEITRGEFIRYIGVAILSVLGVNSMMRNFQRNLGAGTQKRQNTSGYGASAYGR